MKKMVKEYNARGERIYKNPINRENAKKNKKNKIKQDEKSKSKHRCFPHRGGCNQKIYFDQIDEKKDRKSVV